MSRSLRLALGVLVSAAFLAVAFVLSLSDRVGIGFGGVARTAARQLDRIESALMIDVLDRSDVPIGADAMGHIALWAVGMLVVGLALRRHVSLVLLTVSMLGLSLAFEVGQQLFTFSRSAQVTDAVANGIGIIGAAVVVGFVGWALDRRQPAIAS